MNCFKDKNYYLYLIIVIVFFGMLIKMNFSVDTYLLFSSPKMEYIKEYLFSGRIFTFMFFCFLGFLRIPQYAMYILSFIIAIFFSSLSIYTLDKIINKYVNNRFLSSLISISIIINPFIIELWLFVEMGIMMLSIFSMIKAFTCFDNYLDKKIKGFY